MPPAENAKRQFCRVDPRRLEIAVGDIALSYSVDEISAGRPLRTPFEQAANLWVCTGMAGANATTSGHSEFEAYRLSPVNSFKDKVVTFSARTGTAEAKAEAEGDPKGLYHGVLVTYGRAKSVLCGPPVIFVGRDITKRRKRPNPPPSAQTDAAETIPAAAEPSLPQAEAPSEQASSSEMPPCVVPASRLSDDTGDIAESYSADRIGMGQPLRQPFKHEGALWICTAIRGAALTVTGSREHEAYRLVPERLFIGEPTTYSERIATAEAAEAARNDPAGFYHGMKVKFANAAFVICGPPARFVAAQRPDGDALEPAQLSLF